MVTITISGFKTIEEAKKWAMAYQGSVEQNMATAAEGTIGQGGKDQFPWMTENSHEIINQEGENIELKLVHPDNYGK